MRRLAPCLVLLAWISFAEAKLLERLQYDVGFVLTGVHGVLAGTPVSPSWQQRFLGPLAVRALELATHDWLAALQLFMGAFLLAANLLLFAIVRRRGGSLFDGVVAVACFVCAHLLLAYRLEYPWDAIDGVLFLSFGALVARRADPVAAAPLVLVGILNHETIFYLPLWYLLAPLDGRASGRRKELAAGAMGLVVAAGATLVLRRAFYRGRPDLPGQVFEEVTPLIDNHLHVAKNLRTLLVANWSDGRAQVSLGVLLVIGVLVWHATRPTGRRAAVWTLCVLATVVCFGYVNETRHYLAPVAFWFAYAWPAREV